MGKPNMKLIKSITVLTIPNITFEVGGEHNGHAVIQIEDVSLILPSRVEFRYSIQSEDCELLQIINCPVIVGYQTVVVDDQEVQNANGNKG
jgi:hypothetical protein